MANTAEIIIPEISEEEAKILKPQIEKRKHEGTIFFIPENLTALKNGGRISPAIAAIGNTIGLKPVISLVEGELVKTAMTTVVKKAFFDRLNKIISEYPTTEFDYSLVGFDAKEAIFDAIYDNLTKLLNGKLTNKVFKLPGEYIKRASTK